MKGKEKKMDGNGRKKNRTCMENEWKMKGHERK